MILSPCSSLPPNIELGWSLPGRATFLEALATFARVIQFDKRGTGMSDPVPGHASLETRMEDVRAVMDAARSERAALFGVDTGGIETYPGAKTRSTGPSPNTW